MPRFWSAHAWHLTSAAKFRAWVAMVSVLAFVITCVANHGAALRRDFSFYLCLVMFLNAFWHIAATVPLRAYALGVITAVLVVLPMCAWLLFN